MAIDWLARRVGSIIDFRLPSDGLDIPSHVFRARTVEYLAQLRAARIQLDSNKNPSTPDLFDSVTLV